MPKVQVTVKHGIPNQKQDAMSVWIESVTTSQFKVCLRESRTFDGPHNSLLVVRHAFFIVLLSLFLVLSILGYFIITTSNGFERTNYFFNIEETNCCEVNQLIS